MPTARCWPVRAKARCAPSGGLPMLVIGRQILVGGAAIRPELLVFGRPAGTVKRFSIQRCCCRDQTAFDQRPQGPRHPRVAHPRRGAGVDWIIRDQRHTSPRSSGSPMLSRPACSSHSIWRARADWAAACCSAIRTVSETPVVLNSRCAAASRSSSRSINLLVVGTPSGRAYTDCRSSRYGSSCRYCLDSRNPLRCRTVGFYRTASA